MKAHYSKKIAGTIPGMIIGFITLLLFAVLANVFYPIVVANSAGLDPSFLFIVNAAFLIIGVGIIVALWKDMTRGGQEVYVQP